MISPIRPKLAQELVSRCPDDRWSWVEIDLMALARNARTFKRMLPARCEMMAVVKSDAYGHGAVRAVEALYKGGATQFAVATVAEGVALRKAGITWPLLILSQPPLTAIQDMVDYDLMPSVYDQAFALALGECAAAAGKVARYHLILDTGMTRIGVRAQDALELRRSIEFHAGLECAGTFTHFATADEPDDWDFALQLNRFNEACQAMHDARLDLGLVHCDNTPGTILHPECHYDMCRVGIGLYGLQPAETTASYVELEPVMSVRARVTRALYPNVGDGVSYGLTWRVPRKNIQIATIPVGYADGLARELSNKMDVLVNGGRARQVGRICMDQCMFAVDTSGTRSFRPIPEVQVGDVVTLIGRDGTEEISADEMAGLRDTINYEVVCNFGIRLPKVFV